MSLRHCVVRSTLLALVFAAGALVPSAASGQVLYGSITGNVTDASGAAVPNATVEAVNSSTGVAKSVKTDDRGVYLLNDMQAGSYRLTISAPAFGTVTQNGVRVEENAERRVNVQLQLAQVTQNVTVSASAVALQTDRADVNTQISKSEVANLPLSTTRNFESLYRLVPGSSPPQPSHVGASNPQGSLAFNVNGTTSTSNNTRIDGASDMFPWLPEIAAYIPPAEAIESVNVVTNSFDAEQGMGSSSAINVTLKSGTNDFHGAAWEYNTNSDLKARNYFYYGANNPKNILNQFGFDVGGPIRKNKLFFFVDWERTMQRQLLSGLETVPTAAMRAGNFVGTGTTIYNPTSGNSSGKGRAMFPNDQIPASAPHLLLDGNVAFTRLHLSAENTDIGQNYGANVLGIPGTNGSDRLDGGYPDFTLTGFNSLGNTNASNPFLFRDNLWVEAVNLSWSKGSHNLRFGAEFFHFQMADFQANTTYGVRGGFTFSGGLTALSGGASPNLYNSLADFLLGLPTAMGEDHMYINPSVLRQNTYGFYARDQWQINRNLTFRYGLRYELYPYGYSGHFGGIRYGFDTNLVYLGGINGVPYDAGVSTGNGIWAPRVGLAYRLDEKTVIRAGFGINPNAEYFRYNVQVYPEVISTQYSGVNSYSAAGSLVTGIPSFVGPNLAAGALPLPTNVGISSYAQNYRRGYVENYNLTVQRDLGAGFDIQAGFVGTHAIRVDTLINLNAAAPGTGKAGQPFYAAFGNSSSINVLEPFASSQYSALQAQLTRRVGRGTFGAVYTYSKALDFADNGDESGLTFNYFPAIYRNYALAGFDRTHDFQLYGTYDLPFGKGQPFLTHGLASAIAGGREINAIMSRESGTPFSISSCSTSLNAPNAGQTADQVVPVVQILGGHGPGQPYFDPNAFRAVTAVRFGNTGRNIVRGPGLFDLDASVYRTFSLTERVKLQFRAESFGLTNTPQFSNPSANVSNASFNASGQVTNLNGYDTISSAAGERQIRFALKIAF